MDTVIKFLSAGLAVMFCLALILALENIYRLKESTKAWIQVTCTVGMFTLGSVWVSQSETGIEAFARMLVLVFGTVGLNYVLYPPTAPGNSADME